MTILLYCSRVRWVGSPWALDRHTHCLRSIQPAWTPGSCSHTLTIPPSLQRRPGEGYVTHPGAPPETHWDLTHWPLGDKAIILTFETHLTDWYYFCMKDTWDHVSEHRQQGLSISWDWLSWVENTTEPNVSSGTMVWYLMTPTSPSHYLNHCWLAVSMVHKYSFNGNFTSDNPAIKHVKRCLVSTKITSNFIQISQGLTHWGRVMHICDNELGHHWFMLSPVCRQAITWTNDELNCQLDPWEQSSVKFLSKLKHFYWWICIWKCRLRKWRPSCPSLNIFQSTGKISCVQFQR